MHLKRGSESKPFKRFLHLLAILPLVPMFLINFWISQWFYRIFVAESVGDPKLDRRSLQSLGCFVTAYLSQK